MRAPAPVARLGATAVVALLLVLAIISAGCGGDTEDADTITDMDATPTPSTDLNGASQAPASIGQVSNPVVVSEPLETAPVVKTSSASVDAVAETPVTPKDASSTAPNDPGPAQDILVAASPEEASSPSEAVGELETDNRPDGTKAPAAQVVLAPGFSLADDVPSRGGAGRDSEPKVVPNAGDSVEGESYTWKDGDRTLTAHLQDDLVVKQEAGGPSGAVARVQASGAGIVTKGEGQSGSDDDLPVFRSPSGSLMTLPGGVLLILDPGWTEAQTNAFFATNSIKLDRVSELDYVTNGFFVETDPGFPSLGLANELAALDGVEVSSPNWLTEAYTR